MAGALTLDSLLLDKESTFITKKSKSMSWDFYAFLLSLFSDVILLSLLHSPVL